MGNTTNIFIFWSEIVKVSFVAADGSPIKSSTLKHLLVPPTEKNVACFWQVAIRIETHHCCFDCEVKLQLVIKPDYK